MIYAYLSLILLLSIFDIRILKKNGNKKEIFVYIGLMAIALVLGIIYITDITRPTIVGKILDVMNVKE